MDEKIRPTLITMLTKQYNDQTLGSTRPPKYVNITRRNLRKKILTYTRWDEKTIKSKMRYIIARESTNIRRGHEEAAKLFKLQSNKANAMHRYQSNFMETRDYLWSAVNDGKRNLKQWKEDALSLWTEEKKIDTKWFNLNCAHATLMSTVRKISTTGKRPGFGLAQASKGKVPGFYLAYGNELNQSQKQYLTLILSLRKYIFIVCFNTNLLLFIFRFVVLPFIIYIQIYCTNSIFTQYFFLSIFILFKANVLKHVRGSHADREEIALNLPMTFAVYFIGPDHSQFYKLIPSGGVLSSYGTRGSPPTANNQLLQLKTRYGRMKEDVDLSDCLLATVEYDPRSHSCRFLDLCSTSTMSSSNATSSMFSNATSSTSSIATSPTSSIATLSTSSMLSTSGAVGAAGDDAAKKESPTKTRSRSEENFKKNDEEEEDDEEEEEESDDDSAPSSSIATSSTSSTRIATLSTSSMLSTSGAVLSRSRNSKKTPPSDTTSNKNVPRALAGLQDALTPGSRDSAPSTVGTQSNLLGRGGRRKRKTMNEGR